MTIFYKNTINSQSSIYNMNFSEKYPHVNWWIENHGWIEVGNDEYTKSMIRLLDEGGTWWEDKKSKTVDEALANAEAFLIKDIPDRFGEDAMK